MDRRRRPTPMLSWHTLSGGRRRGSRRGADEALFVDLHGHLLFAVAASIAALNMLDAFFTLYFLSYGGQELNPIVDWVLRQGTWWFVGAKSLGIGLCLLFLTLTKNFRTARYGLGVVLVGYTALLGWHLVLLGRIPEA